MLKNQVISKLFVGNYVQLNFYLKLCTFFEFGHEEVVFTFLPPVVQKPMSPIVQLALNRVNLAGSIRT